MNDSVILESVPHPAWGGVIYVALIIGLAFIAYKIVKSKISN